MIESLGRAVLREDAGFHDCQELEGALRQYEARRTARPVAVRRALVALASFPATHSPTPRPTRAVRNLLPATGADRPKRGYGVPIDRWLPGELRSLALDAFLIARTPHRDPRPGPGLSLARRAAHRASARAS
jgi:hypothetical protein